MNNIYFARAMTISPLYRRAVECYGASMVEKNIPEKVFSDPMTLIPVSQINPWLQNLEKVASDPDIILRLIRDVDLGQMGPMSHWFFSGNDLSTTVRRINTGIRFLQSGVIMAGEQAGTILKWTYKNPAIQPDVKVHDGIRLAVFMTKVVRRLLGQNYNPVRVMIPGLRHNSELYRDFFRCDIGWNHDRAEVWMNASERFTLSHGTQSGKGRLAMNFTDLDDLMNMPDPQDEVKVIYETIAYARHFGVPGVSAVSGMLGLSEQQFTRRLHSLGINFTTISGYVLSNLAVNLLSKGSSIEAVSANLGYNHVASFNRMFKKSRGLTPRQFLELQQ